MDLESFVRGLPKAELHLHIEGALEPELMLKLAERNRVDLPYATVEAARKAYAFGRLQDFLDLYYRGASVLLTADDFRELCVAYLERAAADGVRHAEIFFDPQTHTARGVPLGAVCEGLLEALAEGRSRLGISSRLILSFLRHLPEAEALETLRAAEPWLPEIVAVGLDSSELGHPPSNFRRAFAEARRRGLKLTAHAGEEGPPAYIIEALDLLGVERIDHGNRALEDETLTLRLRDAGMTLTVCPLSNLKLCVVSDLARHPLKRMLDLGLRATINSDDPAYFGGYIGENFLQTAQALGLSRAQLTTLARNSFDGAFVSAAAKASYLAEIETFLAAAEASGAPA